MSSTMYKLPMPRIWLQDASNVDVAYCDGEVPREIAYLENRRIVLFHHGEQIVELLVNPQEVCGR
jgi:hypothetical protein